MITLKRSGLSRVPAINTKEKEKQGHWMSNADRKRRMERKSKRYIEREN